MDASSNAAALAAPATAVGPSGWRTVFASMFCLAIGPSCLTILAFGAFVAPLEREFHWGVPAIAFGGSIISIMIMIVSPIQGLLVDRFGGRRVVLCSIPFFALSLCGLYLLPASLTMFYLAWVIIPVCGIGVWPVSYLRTTAGWFEKNLGLALGVTNAGIGIGSALVPLVTAYLIAAYGWREAYLCLGLIAFCAWPVAFLFLKDATPATGGIAQQDGDSLASAAKTRPFWVIFAGFLLLGFVTSSIIIHQVRVMIDAGIPATTATAIPSAFGLALIVGRLCTGWLLDRIRASIIMGVLMTFAVIAMLIYARGPDVPMAILSATLIGLVTGAEFDVLSFIVPRYFGRRSFGQIYGTMFAVFQLASAIGTIVLGAIRGSTGSYSPAMLLLAGVCVVAGLLFTQLGPYRYGVRHA